MSIYLADLNNLLFRAFIPLKEEAWTLGLLCGIKLHAAWDIGLIAFYIVQDLSLNNPEVLIYIRVQVRGLTNPYFKCNIMAKGFRFMPLGLVHGLL